MDVVAAYVAAVILVLIALLQLALALGANFSSTSRKEMLVMGPLALAQPLALRNNLVQQLPPPLSRESERPHLAKGARDRLSFGVT